MAKLRVHGTELARFEREVHKEIVEGSGESGTYVYTYSIRSDGHILRKVKLRYDVKPAWGRDIDWGWKLWKKCKIGIDPTSIVNQFRAKPEVFHESK